VVTVVRDANERIWLGSSHAKVPCGQPRAAARGEGAEGCREGDREEAQGTPQGAQPGMGAVGERKPFSPDDPENTGSNDGVVWSELEEGVRTRCLWPRGPKAKMLFRPAAQLPPRRGRLRLARALRLGCARHGRHAVGAGLEKTQASIVDPTVSIVVVCVLPNFIPSSS
jgi:hypothetical protein